MEDLRGRLGLRKVTFVGDRGVLSAANREGIREARIGDLIARGLRLERADAVIAEILESLSEARDPAVRGRRPGTPAGRALSRPAGRPTYSKVPFTSRMKCTEPAERLRILIVPSSCSDSSTSPLLARVFPALKEMLLVTGSARRSPR